MKLNKRTRNSLFTLIILNVVLATLLWTLILRLIPGAEAFSELTHLHEVGLDLYVFSITLRINPGTFLGIPLGILFFRLIP